MIQCSNRCDPLRLQIRQACFLQQITATSQLHFIQSFRLILTRLSKHALPAAALLSSSADRDPSLLRRRTHALIFTSRQGIRPTPVLDLHLALIIHTSTARQIAALLDRAATGTVTWQSPAGDPVDAAAVQASWHVRARGGGGGWRSC